MRLLLLACPLLLLGTAAGAQLGAANSGSAYATTGVSGGGDDLPAKPVDEGRYVPNDRDGLTGRGGGTATGRTYGATIGTPMGATIGSTIGSTLPLSQPR